VSDPIETSYRPAESHRRTGEAAAFRARVEERLRALEAELSELKTRINGLLFFIAGTVVAQLLLRLLT
jgi:hypothetical protein